MDKEIDSQIKDEIMEAIRRLGGKSDLLSIIGSWGDTLPAFDVLAGLKEWNKNNNGTAGC